MLLEANNYFQSAVLLSYAQSCFTEALLCCLAEKTSPIATPPTTPPQPLPKLEREAEKEIIAAEDVAEGSIALNEVLELQKHDEPVIILDVRSERSFEDSDLLAKGAIRIHPDEAVRKASELQLDKNSWLIAFCA